MRRASESGPRRKYLDQASRPAGGERGNDSSQFAIAVRLRRVRAPAGDDQQGRIAAADDAIETFQRRSSGVPLTAFSLPDNAEQLLALDYPDRGALDSVPIRSLPTVAR